MSRFSRLLLVALLLLGVGPNAVHAQLLSASDATIRNSLCVGASCLDDPTGTFIDAAGSIVLRSIRTRIDFDDTSLVGLPANDWSLIANDPSLHSYFAIKDQTADVTPFKLMAGARENALFVNSNSRIGIGTSLPVSDLHLITGGGLATLRLEENSGTPQAHELIVSNSGGLRVHDVTANTYPFYLLPGAPTYSIKVDANGDIGLGTFFPEGKLHTKGDGVQLAYFESSDGDAVQVRFRTDSQNRRFLAVNNANEVKSQIVFGDNQIQFLGQTVAQEWLRISSAGIVSSGPTCNPNPCDATFDPEAFTVPPIAERASYMWQNMHLPAVGPTVPGEPFNLTEKTAGILHELEIAHIYIAQQAEENAAQSSLIAQQAQVIEELSARVDALEAR